MQYTQKFKDKQSLYTLEELLPKMNLIQNYIQAEYLTKGGPCVSEYLEDNAYIWIAFGVDKKGIYAEFGDHTKSDGRYYFNTYPQESDWTKRRCGAEVAEFIIANWPIIKQNLANELSKQNDLRSSIENFTI